MEMLCKSEYNSNPINKTNCNTCGSNSWPSIIGNFVECNGVAFNFAEQIGYSSTFFQLVLQLLISIIHMQGNLNEGN